MATKVQALNSAADKGFWDEGPTTTLDKSSNWITVGRRASTDSLARANTWFFAFFRPNLSDMVDATFSAATMDFTAAFSDNGTPCTIRIYGLLGNPSVPSTRTQAQALLTGNLTTAYVDWTAPVQTAPTTVLTTPSLTAILDEMAADSARSGSSVPWGFVFAPNGISAGAQIVRTWSAPGASSNLWPVLTTTYAASVPSGGVPYITSALVGGDIYVDAAGGETMTITGAEFFGAGGSSDDVIDLEVDGVETPPVGGLNPLLDAYGNDWWGSAVPASPSLTTSGAQLTTIKSWNLGINVAQAYPNGYDNPVYVASLSDPPRQFTETRPNPDRVHTIPHFPSGAVPATGLDGYMHILDAVTNPDHPVMYTMYGVNPRNGSGPITSCSDAYKFDDVFEVGDFPGSSVPYTFTASGAYANCPPDWNGYGNGPRSAGWDPAAGILHAGHFTRGSIGHALIVGVRTEILMAPGAGSAHINPATMHDTDQSSHTGNCPLGLRLTLDRSFDPEGDVSNAYLQVIARAIYDYGLYFGDRSQGPGLNFYGGGGSQMNTIANSISGSGEWNTVKNALVICHDR